MRRTLVGKTLHSATGAQQRSSRRLHWQFPAIPRATLRSVAFEGARTLPAAGIVPMWPTPRVSKTSKNRSGWKAPLLFRSEQFEALLSRVAAHPSRAIVFTSLASASRGRVLAAVRAGASELFFYDQEYDPFLLRRRLAQLTETPAIACLLRRVSIAVSSGSYPGRSRK